MLRRHIKSLVLEKYRLSSKKCDEQRFLKAIVMYLLSASPLQISQTQNHDLNMKYGWKESFGGPSERSQDTDNTDMSKAP